MSSYIGAEQTGGVFYPADPVQYRPPPADDEGDEEAEHEGEGDVGVEFGVEVFDEALEDAETSRHFLVSLLILPNRKPRVQLMSFPSAQLAMESVLPPGGEETFGPPREESFSAPVCRVFPPGNEVNPEG